LPLPAIPTQTIDTGRPEEVAAGAEPSGAFKADMVEFVLEYKDEIAVEKAATCL
jgi:hypothetical protein